MDKLIFYQSWVFIQYSFCSQSAYNANRNGFMGLCFYICLNWKEGNCHISSIKWKKRNFHMNKNKMWWMAVLECCVQWRFSVNLFNNLSAVIYDLSDTDLKVYNLNLIILIYFLLFIFLSFLKKIVFICLLI